MQNFEASGPVALSENVNLQDLSHYEKQIMRLSFGR